MTTREQELEEQLSKLLDLVEKSGRLLLHAQSLDTRWYMTRRDLRVILHKHGELGDSMLRAVERTREKMFP